MINNDVLRYYVSFNDYPWEQVSPINRPQEISKGITLPKLIILDSSIDVVDSSVKYIYYQNRVDTVRIKIEFDLRNIQEQYFTSPEVKNYRIIITNKNGLLNI